MRKNSKIRSWLSALLVLSLMTIWPFQRTAMASHGMLMWNDGSSFTVFGPNEAVMIAIGTIDYVTTCPNPDDNDVLYGWSDIYVVPSGSASGSLSDVSGTPNTVMGAGGGGFFDEVVGYTAPGGSIGPGTYALVYDNCQDGIVDQYDSVFDPAFRVVFSTNVPPLPADLAGLKSQAEQDAQSWQNLHLGLRVAFKLIDMTGKKAPAVNYIKGMRMGLNLFGVKSPQQVALIQIVSQYQRFQGIAADPPDPNFQSVTPLAPRTVIDPQSTDPLLVAAANLGTAASNGETIAQALLTSLERYQGADQVGAGDWALIHARAIRQYALDLAAHTATSTESLGALESALAADTRPLETVAAELTALRTRVAAEGFSAEELQEMRNLGLTDAEIETYKSQLLAEDFTFDKAGFMSHLAAMQADSANLIASLQNLASEVTVIIDTLKADGTVYDLAPAANAGGPYTGSEGTPIAFDGSGSASPSAIVTYEWDLNGDGEFDDATGATASYTYSNSFDGHVGLRVTSADGLANVDYAPVSVSEVNHAAAIQYVSPADDAVDVVVGEGVTLDVTAHDPDGDPVTISWWVDGAAAGTGSTFTFNPDPSQLGMRILQATATDTSPLGGSATHTWVASVLLPDGDGDGWRSNTDCDDADPATHPGAKEIIGNGKDDDCDPSTSDDGTPPTAGFTTSQGLNAARLEDGATIVAYSSTYNLTSLRPEYAIDNNTGSAWASASGQTTNQWLTVGLTGNRTHVVDRVTLRGSTGTDSIKDFEIRVANEAGAFTTVYSGTLPRDGASHSFTFAPQSARQVQLVALNNWGSTSLTRVYQFQVWTRDRAGGIVSLKEGPPATVTASSAYSTSYRPEYALDESTSAWRSANTQNTDQWLKIQLGGGLLYSVDRVRLQSRATGEAVREFEIRVSDTTNNDSAFTTVYTGTAANTTAMQEFTFPAVTARHVQLVVKNNHGSACCVGITTLQVLTPDGRNAAQLEGVGAHIVAASSHYNSSYTPDRAIDYSSNTLWLTGSGQTTDQWLTVGLVQGAPYLVDRVMLLSGTGTDSVRDFEVRVATEGTADSDFTTVYSGTMPLDGQAHWYAFSPVPARYVQLVVKNNHGYATYTRVASFQVFSASLGGAQVAFDDLSVDVDGPLASWHWDFGDGNSSTEQHPVHTYAAPGTYPVSLTVTDGQGDTASYQSTYTVLAAPVADFSWTPEQPTEGQLFYLTDISTDLDGQVLDWQWQFAHTTSQPTGRTTSARLPDNGDYPVTLTVTDSQLLSASVTYPITALNAPPTANAGSNQTVVWGQPWTPNGSASDPGTTDRTSIRCDWDYGDGQTRTITNCSSSVNAPHTYTEPGTYTATLTVTDKDGATATDTAVITVTQRQSFVHGYSAKPVEQGKVEFSAKLYDRYTWTGLPGMEITFSYGGQTVQSPVNADGTATVLMDYEPDVAAVTISYTGNTFYAPSAMEKALSAPLGDIVFIVDESGSMSPYINQTKARVADIAMQLGARVDFQLGLVGFGAGGGHQGTGYAGQPHIHTGFTHDIGQFVTSLNQLVDTGGFEPGFAATTLAMSESMGFRSLAGSCAILITDEDADISTQAPETREDALAALLARNAVFLGIVNLGSGTTGNDYGPNPQSLAAVTGGQVFRVSDFIQNSAPVMESIMDNCINRIVTPDLNLSVDNGVDSVKPGDIVTYTLTVQNQSSGHATGVALTNPLPANTTFTEGSDGATVTDGIVTWPTFDLQAGAVAIRTLTLRVDSPFPAEQTTLTNEATVTDDGANGPDPTPANNSASDTDIVLRPSTPPTADAGGPYTALEGSSVTLDGSNSFHPEGTIVLYEWDLDADGAYDDSEGVTADILFPENGTYTVALRVTDSDGLTHFDEAQVTVLNVAPAVTLLGDALPEGGTATLTFSFTDPGVLDAHTATIDWGDGTQELVSFLDKSGSASHTYGDNGAYPVVLTVTDDDQGVGTATAAVHVANETPTLQLLLPTSVVDGFAGGSAMVAKHLQEQEYQAHSTDPGSDDLSFTWSFGVSAVYHNDGSSPDQPLSPHGTFPFQAADSAVHAFLSPGVHDLSVRVTDDDGASAISGVKALVVGTTSCTRSQGFWHKQLSASGQTHFDEATVNGFLEIVNYGSAVFSESIPVGSIAEAYAVMTAKRPSMRDHALSQHMAAWLNYASGSIGWYDYVDLDGDGAGDMMFAHLVAEVEAILLNPDATHAQLVYAKDLAEAVNLLDSKNPACAH